jgi:hypothetical protein
VWRRVSVHLACIAHTPDEELVKSRKGRDEEESSDSSASRRRAAIAVRDEEESSDSRAR